MRIIVGFCRASRCRCSRLGRVLQLETRRRIPAMPRCSPTIPFDLAYIIGAFLAMTALPKRQDFRGKFAANLRDVESINREPGRASLPPICASVSLQDGHVGRFFLQPDFRAALGKIARRNQPSINHQEGLGAWTRRARRAAAPSARHTGSNSKQNQRFIVFTAYYQDRDYKDASACSNLRQGTNHPGRGQRATGLTFADGGAARQRRCDVACGRDADPSDPLRRSRHGLAAAQTIMTRSRAGDGRHDDLAMTQGHENASCKVLLALSLIGIITNIREDSTCLQSN